MLTEDGRNFLIKKFIYSIDRIIFNNEYHSCRDAITAKIDYRDIVRKDIHFVLFSNKDCNLELLNFNTIFLEKDNSILSVIRLKEPLKIEVYLGRIIINGGIVLTLNTNDLSIYSKTTKELLC